jgi:hypothetical protein
MFGGYKEGVGQTNNLYWITPKHKSNLDMISQKKGVFEFKFEFPSLSVEVTELHPDGKPPTPRMMHSAVHFSEKYLGSF